MRASENVEADATVGGNVMFANVNSTTDVLRVQLRDSASSRVVLQGAFRISRPVTSSPASGDGGNHWHRGPCTSSACHIQLGSSRDTDCSVSLSLNVTSFWHRWGYGSERAVVSAARGMTLAWVSRRSDRAGGVGGQHPPPVGKPPLSLRPPIFSTKQACSVSSARRLKIRSSHGARSRAPPPGASSLDSLQRNVEMMTSACSRMATESLTQPGVAVVVQITDAVVSMVMKLLGSRSAGQHRGKNVVKSHPSSIGDSDERIAGAEFGRQRARAVRLLETTIWSASPAEMLVTTLQTTLVASSSGCSMARITRHTADLNTHRAQEGSCGQCAGGVPAPRGCVHDSGGGRFVEVALKS